MPTVTSKGQITLPKEVRDALGLVPGSEVEFQLESGRAILRADCLITRDTGYYRTYFPELKLVVP